MSALPLDDKALDQLQAIADDGYDCGDPSLFTSDATNALIAQARTALALAAQVERLMREVRCISDARTNIDTTKLMMLTLTNATKSGAARAWGLTDDEMSAMCLLLNYSADLRRLLSSTSSDALAAHDAAVRAAALREAAGMADVERARELVSKERAIAAGREGVASHRQAGVETAERICDAILAAAQDAKEGGR